MVVKVLLLHKALKAAGTLEGPFIDVCAQVVLKSIHFDEDCVAMWTSVLPLLVNRHVPLVMRLFLKKLVTLGTVIKAICMGFFMLLQGSFKLKLLPTDGTCPIVHFIHVCGKLFRTCKGLRAQGTDTLFLLLVFPHMSLQILWEGEGLRTPATCVILSVRCFAVA